MSEEALKLLISYNTEVNIPYKAFWKMIKIIEEYGKNKYLSETSLIEIATTSMTLWQYGFHIRKTVNLALQKLGYSRVGNIISFDEEKEYFGGLHR